MKHDSYPKVLFKTPGEFEEFLKKEFDKQSLSIGKVSGIWMKIAKKNSGAPGISYDEALEVALCYGWIDGQAASFDEKYYLVKFTPRGPKSMWSGRNVGIVERLINEGRMRSPGLEKIEAAKKDGRWENAYDSSKNIVMPAEFMEQLKKDKKAYEFYLRLNKSNIYAIYYRLHSAKKPETRERRMNVILGMLRKGEKFY